MRIGQGASFGGWRSRVPRLTMLDNPRPRQPVHEPPHMPLLAEIGGFAEVEANACPSGPIGEMPGPARCVPYLDTYGRAPLHRMAGDSPDTRRSLAVVPPLANGGTTASLRRGYGAARGRVWWGVWRNRWPMGLGRQVGFAAAGPRHTSQAHGQQAERTLPPVFGPIRKVGSLLVIWPSFGTVARCTCRTGRLFRVVKRWNRCDK